MSVRQRRSATEYRATFALTRISIIPRSLIHCRAKQTTKYVYPELNAIQLLFLVLLSTRHTTYSSFFHLRAIQLVPRSFIHCRAKRKSILDIGSRSDWHISVGELTFDVGESTSYVGELVVGELTRWRNDRYSPDMHGDHICVYSRVSRVQFFDILLCKSAIRRLFFLSCSIAVFCTLSPLFVPFGLAFALRSFGGSCSFRICCLGGGTPACCRASLK